MKLVPFLGAMVFSAVLCPSLNSLWAQTSTSLAGTPIAATAPTAVPALVPYSGAAIGSDGKAVGSEAAVTFLIYKDEAAGEPLWSETQSVAIDVTGHYKVQLGATSPNGLPAELFATGEARWLEVEIAGQAAQARVLLASVPYALKASDAATLGGLPASAFALAGTGSGTGKAATAGAVSNTSSGVTTPGGTAGQLAKFSDASTIVSSIVTDTGTKVGIGTSSPEEVLDVNGYALFRSNVILDRIQEATTTNGGGSSSDLVFTTGVIDSTTKTQIRPLFQLRAEPTGNNTTTPSSTLNLLFNNGNTTAETGLHFNGNGTIHFAAGQSFPGTGTGTITGVTAGTGLTGGGTSGNVTLNLNTAQVPLLSGNNAFTGSETIAGSLTSSSNLSYAIEGIDSSAGGSGLFGMATSTSGYSSGVYGTSASTTGSGVSGNASSPTGYTNGVYGRTASSSGTGVGGAATSATGYTNGVYGTSASPNGTGVSGNASSLTGNAIGTSGTTASPAGVGVQGVNFSTTGGSGVNGISLATSGYTSGVYGKSTSVNGAGVNGQATSATGTTTGVVGSSASPNGTGVYGIDTSNTGGTGVNGTSNATSGYTSGVYGSAASPTGAGVSGFASSATGYNTGVSGQTQSVNGTGVNGQATSTTGNTVGTSGTSASPNGTGVFGVNNAATGGTGVNGVSNATSGYGNGVFGSSASPTGNGVHGDVTAPNGQGVYGSNEATTGSAYGVLGISASVSGSGVFGNETGTSGYTVGVYGTASSPLGVGVRGDSLSTTGSGPGVYGTSNSPFAAGVGGTNNSTTGPAIGVIGVSASSSDGATGVNGSATGRGGNAYGVLGSSLSPQGYGVFGFSPNIAVAGVSKTCTSSGCTIEPGTAAQFVTGVGGVVLQGVRQAADFTSTQVFYVDASGNGYFAGNLNVTGKVVKGSGSFKIDDPLDPANKYLSHSFVESPDMMNVYNGNVKTDKSGRATVELPEYFESLNSDFRYQLTVMGQFAEAIVDRKIGATQIGHNRFVIRTSKPSVEVSWQVTGIRKDAYAAANRIPVEEEKPTDERGYYLHPEVFNQPPSKGIVAAHQSDAPSKSVAQLNSAGRR